MVGEILEVKVKCNACGLEEMIDADSGLCYDCNKGDV